MHAHYVSKPGKIIQKGENQYRNRMTLSNGAFGLQLEDNLLSFKNEHLIADQFSVCQIQLFTIMIQYHFPKMLMAISNQASRSCFLRVVGMVSLILDDFREN